MRLERLWRSAAVCFSCVVCFTFMTLVGGSGAAAEKTLESGIDRAGFDTAVKPADNFFQYVNGTWIKNNPIPPEYSRWGAFPKLRDDNLIALHQILEALAQESPPAGSERQKLRDLYSTAMDEAKADAAGAAPLAGMFEKIAQIKSPDDLITEIGHLQMSDPPLFRFMVRQDQKDSEHYAAYFFQDGLGLPERDYYIGKSEDSKRIRDLYREHVAAMLRLLGDSPEAATRGAAVVLRIETQLAEKSRTPVQLRDPEKQYNKKTLAELSQLSPEVNWDLYLKSLDLTAPPFVIVGQPEFFQRVSEVVHTVPIADWRTYLRWHVVHAMAPYLSRAFEGEDFRFYSGTLRGVKEMQPRWKRAVTAIDLMMGEALGKLYVEKYFTPTAKKRMDELVKNVMTCYRERIESREWMSDATKKQALAKLEAVMPKIGYPSKWRDYTALEISGDSYAANALRAADFESHYRLSKLGKPVDRTEWGMTPPTVNAYYNPSMNEIVFPAGILQPPFFNAAADDAVNYGGIGAVIGHELTHGFDDSGSHYDAAGNLKNWWTASDRAKFQTKTDALVKEYDACVPLENLHVNGRLTLGENIADLGGVTISYAAYQRSLGGQSAPVIDGLTGLQRFFMGFAQVWRGSSRPAEQRLRLRTDPHSPPQFRTLVPLSNIAAFYKAFDVKEGDKMYRSPQERVEIW